MVIWLPARGPLDIHFFKYPRQPPLLDALFEIAPGPKKELFESKDNVDFGYAIQTPDYCGGRCCVFSEIVKLLAVDLLEAYTREQTSVTKRMTIHG